MYLMLCYILMKTNEAYHFKLWNVGVYAVVDSLSWTKKICEGKICYKVSLNDKMYAIILEG